MAFRRMWWFHNFVVVIVHFFEFEDFEKYNYVPTKCDLGLPKKSKFPLREVYLQYLLSVQSQKLLNQSKEYFFDGRRPSYGPEHAWNESIRNFSGILKNLRILQTKWIFFVLKENFRVLYFPCKKQFRKLIPLRFFVGTVFTTKLNSGSLPCEDIILKFQVLIWKICKSRTINFVEICGKNNDNKFTQILVWNVSKI